MQLITLPVPLPGTMAMRTILLHQSGLLFHTQALLYPPKLQLAYHIQTSIGHTGAERCLANKVLASFEM